MKEGAHALDPEREALEQRRLLQAGEPGVGGATADEREAAEVEQQRAAARRVRHGHLGRMAAEVHAHLGPRVGRGGEASEPQLRQALQLVGARRGLGLPGGGGWKDCTGHGC